MEAESQIQVVQTRAIKSVEDVNMMMGRQLLEEMMSKRREAMEQMKAWFVHAQQECLQQLTEARNEKSENNNFSDSLTRGAGRKKLKPRINSRRRRENKCSGYFQKLDIKKEKKLLHRCDRGNILLQKKGQLADADVDEKNVPTDTRWSSQQTRGDR